MGVSGVGKTTLGKAVAEIMGLTFLDADDFHSTENIRKMSEGVPLDDMDRAPWLAALNARLVTAPAPVLLACSALKQKYRDQLAAGCNIHWVWLHGAYDVIAARLAKRRTHYMPALLLDSQLATLEPPGDAISVDVAGEQSDIVRHITDMLVAAGW
jgi:gluconokinase